MVNVLDDPSPGLDYRRLRAPGSHGESLQVPPLDRCELVTPSEERWVAIQAESFSPAGLATAARQDLLSLARGHSTAYRDIDLDSRAVDRIVMSGHQPNLFHPGVWFKNFALDQLGMRLNAIPINLMVDNDLCGVTSIPLPVREGKAWQLDWIPYDAAGDHIPFEDRPLKDSIALSTFPDRVATAIRPLVHDPLVGPLWNQVDRLGGLTTLGEIVAAARHGLEGEWGLQTLEVPLSSIAQTHGFALFTREILQRLPTFQEIYNGRLAEYRRLHRIRSRSHPVPELVVEDSFAECPYWIWTSDRPVRRRLFARLADHEWILTDRQQTEVRVPDGAGFEEAFVGLMKKGVRIRPRALITTLYSRLFLSDLFLHGIGGAKYDQLTDAIAADFFGTAPPPFATLTATFHLPHTAPEITPADLTRLQVQRRELRFHPEKFVDAGDPDAAQWMAEKQKWLATEPLPGEGRRRHEGIESANEHLQEWLSDQRQAIDKSLSKMRREQRSSQILHSREYSFCLFPPSLVEELKALVGASAPSLTDAS